MLLASLLAVAAGAGAVLLGVLLPVAAMSWRAVGLFGFAVSVAVGARARAARFPADTPGLGGWRAVATPGAALAVLACVALGARVLMEK